MWVNWFRIWIKDNRLQVSLRTSHIFVISISNSLSELIDAGVIVDKSIGLYEFDESIFDVCYYFFLFRLNLNYNNLIILSLY